MSNPQTPFKRCQWSQLCSSHSKRILSRNYVVHLVVSSVFFSLGQSPTSWKVYFTHCLLPKSWPIFPALDLHRILFASMTHICSWHILTIVPRRVETNSLGISSISFSFLYSLGALHIEETLHIFVELKHNKGLYFLY